MIWYIIWKYGIIIGLIYFLYKLFKEKTVLNNLKKFIITVLILSVLCITINLIISYNTSVENLKFSKIEAIELISYPDADKTIYTYIDSNKYHVITKKNNIVEPQSYFSSTSDSTTKVKFIKSNKAYIEIYKPISFKNKNWNWLTTHIPDYHRQYYICIPENTFVIKDE